MKKLIPLLMIVAVLFAGCTPYSELVPQTPRDVLDVAMYVVTGGSNPAPLVVGADGSPGALRAPTGLAAQISAKVTCEVVSLTENGDTAAAVLNITAPDAVGLFYQALEGMKTYDEEAFTEKFEGLLADAPTKVFPVELELVRLEGVWCIQINEDFSNAITGGLMAEYTAVQQAILDKLTEGGEG